MATRRTRISARISAETHELLERYVQRHGVTRSHLIETALQHYCQAPDAVPPEEVVPPVIEVSRETGEQIMDWINNPPAPTPAMRELFDGS